MIWMVVDSIDTTRRQARNAGESNKAQGEAQRRKRSEARSGTLGIVHTIKEARGAGARRLPTPVDHPLRGFLLSWSLPRVPPRKQRSASPWALFESPAFAGWLSTFRRYMAGRAAGSYCLQSRVIIRFSTRNALS